MQNRFNSEFGLKEFSGGVKGDLNDEKRQKYPRLQSMNDQSDFERNQSILNDHNKSADNINKTVSISDM